MFTFDIYKSFKEYYIFAFYYISFTEKCQTQKNVEEMLRQKDIWAHSHVVLNFYKDII